MIDELILKYLDEDSEEAKDYRKMRQDQMDAEHFLARRKKYVPPVKKKRYHSNEIKERDPHDYS